MNAFKSGEPKVALTKPAPMKVDNDDDLINDAFQDLKIAAKEVVCQYIDKELIKQTGTFLQFINLNSTGSTTMIGGTRIAVSDIRKVPAYLARNKALIRQHAVFTLNEHLLETQCPAGALENLTAEDYSISFAVATVSEEAKRLNPMGRSEGPLFYCAFNNLVDPIALYQGPSSMAVHIINVYIMLLDPLKRRTAVIKKAREEEAAWRENQLKPKQAQIDYLKHKDAQRRFMANPMTAALIFPPLPEGPAPEWNRSGRTALPAE